jgi:hypothetical protein
MSFFVDQRTGLRDTATRISIPRDAAVALTACSVTDPLCGALEQSGNGPE